MIEFKRKPGDIFTIGKTGRGNLISFVEIRESDLILFDPTTETAVLDNKPTSITLYSDNIIFSDQMLDVLEASKILRVKEKSNDGQQVVIYPLFSFDFSKLQSVLLDITEKFNL